MNCSGDFRERNFALSSYKSQQNKELPMYQMTKDGFAFLVMGYTGQKAAKFKEDFIMEFNKREELLLSDDYILHRAFEIQKSKVLKLETQIEQKQKVIELQESELKQAAPKVEYHDRVLSSETLIPTTIIAKELGMSAKTLNQILAENGIQYKTNGTWVLYAKYQDEGYHGTKTYSYTDSHGNQRSSVNLFWTEKGRKFIHSLISEANAS